MADNNAFGVPELKNLQGKNTLASQPNTMNQKNPLYKPPPPKPALQVGVPGKGVNVHDLA